MKPRLIDANEARKAFDPNTWQGDMMISILDNIPTAYDTDKVVEQLGYALNDCIPRINGKECNKREKTVYAMALEYAIEIVKGGVECTTP